MNTLPSQRGLFDIPEEVAYFNAAYNSPELVVSRQRLIEAVSAKTRPWERQQASFFADADAVRVLAADTFGGKPDGWAVVPSASYGVSTAARIIEPELGPGDGILVLAEEFPSQVLPWQRVARSRGAGLITVSTPVDGDWTAAVLAAIRPEIRVVAVSPCHWTDGARVDLVRVAESCRAIGARLVVDASQALGAMPLPLSEIRPDFLVAAGYKWLLCPYGFGLLFVADAWRNARPLEETWLARSGAEDFADLVRYSDAYRPGARRFDVGETCTPLLPGALAALDQLREWGTERIAASLALINERIISHLEPLGFEFPPQKVRCPHLVGARVPERLRGFPLVEGLKRDRVYISQRGSAVRFAPHLHVNDADLDRLFSALTRLVSQA